MEKERFYVVGLYGDSASLLTPTGAEAAFGLTLPEARRAVWWQYHPRGESETPWFICTPDLENPGIMVGRRVKPVIPTGGPLDVSYPTFGRLVRLDIGGHPFPPTLAAHRSAVAIWGAEASTRAAKARAAERANARPDEESDEPGPGLWAVFDCDGDRVAGPFSERDAARRARQDITKFAAVRRAEDYGRTVESHLTILNGFEAYYVRRCDEDGREIRGQA